MFPSLVPCAVSDGTINALVKWMGDPRNRSINNPRIPAGYTYLGQFIDHDITFDPTTRIDGRAGRPRPVNFRTPRFDLDSVYGSGPLVQPFLYNWKTAEPTGAELLVGHGEAKSIRDLPRNDEGRALIGDPRNDENVIVGQLHLLFIRFHNAVVRRLRGEVPERELFDEAQQTVRWHYQWIVVHDFLPLVVGESVARDVLPPAPRGAAQTVNREFFRWQTEPFIPLEFSAAAYRFGHSMVRGDYGIKRLARGAAGLHTTPLFPNLRGLARLKRDRVIRWERFFELTGEARQVQFSHTIDTAIADALFDLPDRKDPTRKRSLPTLNLERGRLLELPSGQDVAAVMQEEPLSEEELHFGELPPRVQRELRKKGVPLWYYILCETARAKAPDDRPLPGRHLGPVGGRIVAEVLAGLLAGDRSSYLAKKPQWRPTLGADGDFRMADLVEFVQDAER